MFKYVADSLICKQINGSWSLKWRWQTSRAPHSNDFPPQNISQVTEAEERINFKQKAEKSYQDKTTVLVVQDCKSDQTMRGHFHRKKTHTHTHTHCGRPRSIYRYRSYAWLNPKLIICYSKESYGVGDSKWEVQNYSLCRTKAILK